MNKPDTLFYDGNCPLCMREVRLLTRIADEGLLWETFTSSLYPDHP